MLAYTAKPLFQAGTWNPTRHWKARLLQSGAVLVVREVEDDRVVRAGLQLDAQADEAPVVAGPLAKVRSVLKSRFLRG